MDRTCERAQWTGHVEGHNGQGTWKCTMVSVIEEHTGQGRARASGRAHGAGLVEGDNGQGT